LPHRRATLGVVTDREADMAGALGNRAGQVPKPADQRARRNKDPMATRAIPLHRAPQPKLGHCPISDDGKWCERTVAWWGMWDRSPLANDFTEADWEYLLETALANHLYWTTGSTKYAAELRLRTANFGMTPADRARLRIVWADADAKAGSESKTKPQASGRPEGGAYSSLRLAD
jgi:hypothetical protein